MAALVAVLVFALSVLAQRYLGVGMQLDDTQQAYNLSEAAVARAIERCQQNERFGNEGTSADKTVVTDFQHAEHSQGRLSFDKTKANSLGVPFSTNNLQGENAVPGAFGPVPPYTIHLVAVGRSHRVGRQLEVVLRIPAFKFSVATNGGFTTTGKTWIAAVDKPEDVLPDLDSQEDKLLPGHLASNSSDASALTLDSSLNGQKITVTGDAVSRGGIVLRNPGSTRLAEVRGQQKTNANRTPLPEIKAEDYDPLKFGRPQSLPDGSFDPSHRLPIQGMVRRVGSLTINNDLDLQKGGFLWVDGDITVDGTIKGTGAVFATGSITMLKGGNEVKSDNVAAIVANRNLTLNGANTTSSNFQGVVYSGGDVDLTNMNLVGTLIGNGSESSVMRLSNASVIHNKQIAEFEFEYPFGPDAWDSWGGLKQHDMSLFYDAANDKFDPNKVTEGHIERRLGPPPGGANMTRADFWAAAPTASPVPSPYADWSDYENQVEQKVLNGLKDDVAAADKYYQLHKDPSVKKGKMRFDPNVFLQLRDKLRVMLWRER